jgi:hypothetical protein
VNEIHTEAITPWLEILWDQKGSDLVPSTPSKTSTSLDRARLRGSAFTQWGATALALNSWVFK